MKQLILMLMAAVLLQAAAVSAEVIDFESLASDDAGYYEWGTSYTEGGYQLTSDDMFASDGLQSSLYLGGSTYVYTAYMGEYDIALTSRDGSLFDVSSIDLAELMLPYGGTDVSVTFTGTKADSTTVATTFTLDGSDGWETFLFGDEFSSLTSLVWNNVADYHAFDNITVEASSVPVPAAIWLLGSGLVGLAGLRRKKNA